MAFVDEARIFLKAGDGGKGCESFHREKGSKFPKPDGGDGGQGGDITFRADSRIHTLLDFRFKQHYKAGRGGHGGSRGKKGKKGTALLLKIPAGTILRDVDSDLLIKDLTEPGQEVIVVRGGIGGRGNEKRRHALPPRQGEERTVRLELKLIADVGLVGFPNAGKSTLVTKISKVKSKIAGYPFTTKQPVLGVVHASEGTYVIADLPGLIEGAHRGRGLGDRFLKHAERTKILVHMVDMAGTDGRNPLDDYDQINEALMNYGSQLPFKKRILVANKMDCPEAKENLRRFKKKYRKRIIAVSAATGMGLEPLTNKLERLVLGRHSKASFEARTSEQAG